MLIFVPHIIFYKHKLKQMKKKPVLLCILDGWGNSEIQDNNAIQLAKTPNWDNICATYPISNLKTDGLDVGLGVGGSGMLQVHSMTKLTGSTASICPWTTSNSMVKDVPQPLTRSVVYDPLFGS